MQKALANIEDMDAALQNYAKKSVADIKAANGDGSVEAASIDGKLMAFPMTGGNGYFLYYDSSVISDEDAATWDTLLAAADKAGKKVGMTLASGWYNASFFYGQDLQPDSMMTEQQQLISTEQAKMVTLVYR